MKTVMSILSFCALLGFAVSGLTDPVAASGSAAREAAPELLRRWVDARAGTGEPVHWVSEGGVYEYPSGKKLFGMIGFDSSTAIWPDDPGTPVLHLTRKTYAYTDPMTGEVLTEFNDNVVEPIAYPYQLIRYRAEGDQIFGDVEQGVGDRIQEILAKEGMRTRFLGDGTLAVTASVFLDIPLGEERRLQAWENYDFFLHDDSVDEPHQLAWQRFGDLPRWAGKGKAIYHMLSWRVESHAEFPEQTLAWAKANKSQWLRPPADLAEIRRIQAGDGIPSGAGW